MRIARSRSTTRPLRKAGSQTIGFRLDAEHRRLLGEQAEQAQVTPHEFARNSLIAALDEPERLATVQDALGQVADWAQGEPERALAMEQAINQLAAQIQDGAERSSAVEHALLQLAGQMQDLRASLIVATEGVLIAAGEMLPQDAKMWVQRYLNHG